jgi:hypothetical protein
VQRALRQVMQRLLSGRIDHKQAGQILYKLQTASMNLGARPSEAKCTRREFMPVLARMFQALTATFASSASSQIQEDLP